MGLYQINAFTLTSFKQFSKEPKAFLSVCFALGVNPLLREWSSTKPFSRIGLLHSTGLESGPHWSILFGLVDYILQCAGVYHEQSRAPTTPLED